MDIGTLNLAWAQALVDGLAAAGVREAVISPGSRSTPLALAFLRQERIRSRVIIDERSAAFFALGLARGTGQPAALLCTSGSAPANWYPAVIEADQDAVPLLLLSADRPAELRGWGANQTIDQQKLFGPHVRAAHALATPEPAFIPDFARRLAARLVSESLWPLPGPVHVNLPFREPLLPAGDWPPVGAPPPVAVSKPKNQPQAEDVSALAARLSGRLGAIVCGGGRYPAGFAEALARLAEKLGVPVLAEPLSNLRFGKHDRSHFCVRYEAFLRRPSFTGAYRPAWLLRFGAFPVCRSLQDWLATCGAEQVLVDPGERWADPLHAAASVFQSDPLELCEALCGEALSPAADSWCASFLAEEDRAAQLALEQDGEGCFEDGLIPALIARLPAGHRLFCGNSMAIRDLDTYSGTGAKNLGLHGNRGASGIDGNISTAAGLAATGPTVALIGDVSCAHDIGGLAAMRGLDLVLVVPNNGGGAIFGYLPQAGLPDFERAWLTPPGVDFRHAAATWGITYGQALSLPAFTSLLDEALAAGGPQLIEVIVDRAGSLARHKCYGSAVSAD
jgi:2-succinyl-5-enolpyruvyl-6-hydroxy-3-cyclohexene-1-carboxylate synthase